MGWKSNEKVSAWLNSSPDRAPVQPTNNFLWLSRLVP
jgi:hypothetical protein